MLQQRALPTSGVRTPAFPELSGTAPDRVGTSSAVPSCELSMRWRLKLEQVVEGEDEGGAEEDEQGDAPAGLAIDFGEEIGARNVKGDAAGKRESVLKLAGEEAGQEDARERSQAEAGGGLEGAPAALATGENNGGHGKTFGELVEKA